MITVGDYNKLKVVRKSDLGYMLTDGTDEVLMHYKQASGEIEMNKWVNVFIYSDKEKRPTATMVEPITTIVKAGFVNVVDTIPGVGVFVNINTPKDILISRDYLPYKEDEWPVVGDTLLIRLKVKKDVLTGKPLNRFEIGELKSEAKYAEQEKVSGYVFKFSEKGVGIVTKDLVYVFVPNSQYRGNLRMGEEVTVTITKFMNNEAYGTLNEHKELLIDTDREIILEYLNRNGGVMRLTAKSSSEEIEKFFNMSRKAFKRAYGGLYKDQLITFNEERTFLNKKKDTE